MKLTANTLKEMIRKELQKLTEEKDDEQAAYNAGLSAGRNSKDGKINIPEKYSEGGLKQSYTEGFDDGVDEQESAP